MVNKDEYIIYIFYSVLYVLRMIAFLLQETNHSHGHNYTLITLEKVTTAMHCNLMAI